MKKTFLTAAIFCAVSFAFAQSASRNVLLESAVGTWDGFTPDGDLHIDSLNLQYPYRFFIPVRFHNSDDLETTESQGIDNFFQISSYPGGMVDRVLFPGNSKVSHSRSAWAGNVAQRINVGAPVQLEISRSFNETSQEISARVKASFTNPVSGDMRIHLFVLENNVVIPTDPQANNYSSASAAAGGPSHPFYNLPASLPNYVHNYVLRAAPSEDSSPFSGAQGTSGVIPSSVIKGSIYSHNYTYEVPPGMDVNEIVLVAFISYYDSQGGAGNEVLNAASTYLINPPDFCLASFDFNQVDDEVSFYNTSTTAGYDSLKWAFGDGNTSTMENPQHVYSERGVTFKACLALFDSAGILCSSTCESIRVTPVGVEEQLAANPLELSVSPNPLNLLAMVQFNLPQADNVSVEVLDIMGRSVKVLRSGHMVAGEQAAAIDVTALPNGMYFVQVTTSADRVVKKVLIAH